jgi:hypothetical protein
MKKDTKDMAKCVGGLLGFVVGLSLVALVVNKTASIILD